MKRVSIVALVCINVGLLLALVLGTQAPQAKAQTVGGRTDYVVMTGKITSNSDALYVIDTGRRSLAAWKFDRTSKKLIPFRPRDLKNDFRR